MVYGYNDNLKILGYSQERMMICTKTYTDYGCGYNDHVIYLAVALIMVVSMVDNVKNGYLKTTMSHRYISHCSNGCDHPSINIINAYLIMVLVLKFIITDDELKMLASWL